MIWEYVSIHAQNDYEDFTYNVITDSDCEKPLSMKFAQNGEQSDSRDMEKHYITGCFDD